MKRYGLFAGEKYYPSGGWYDLLGTFDTIPEALSAPRKFVDWWHVIDFTLGVIVAEGADA